MAIVGTFCVDTSEVTQAQYAAFLSAKGTDTSGQPKTECEWNTSYEPAFFTWGTNEASLTFCSNATKFDPATKPNHPVSCIDWCDARAFCEWAGKRLCGGIGGVKVDNWNSLDPQVAEWPYVATNGAKDTQWPYPAESQCVIGGAANEPVKNRPLCHGTPAPFDAVFDLSGNVAEWADDCDPGWGPGGPTAECRAHGGSGQSSVQSANWNSYETFSRDTTRGRVGFRCCANATQ